MKSAGLLTALPAGRQAILKTEVVTSVEVK